MKLRRVFISDEVQAERKRPSERTVAAGTGGVLSLKLRRHVTLSSSLRTAYTC